MHSPGALARRGGAPFQGAGDPPPTDGLCSFCLPSDARPLVGRVDDSACGCARGMGVQGEGGQQVKSAQLAPAESAENDQ